MKFKEHPSEQQKFSLVFDTTQHHPCAFSRIGVFFYVFLVAFQVCLIGVFFFISHNINWRITWFREQPQRINLKSRPQDQHHEAHHCRSSLPGYVFLDLGASALLLAVWQTLHAAGSYGRGHGRGVPIHFVEEGWFWLFTMLISSFYIQTPQLCYSKHASCCVVLVDK